MGIEKSKIDMVQLRKEIQRLTTRQELYTVLREELLKLDYWKQKARGKPNYNFKKR
jgi:hypothetical protein